MSQPNADTTTDRGSRFKLWAVGIILVMIVAMLLPLNLSGRGPGGQGSASPTIGTTRDGSRVTAADRSSAMQLLETLDSVFVQVGQMPRPIAEVCWSPTIVQKFRREPEALFLLLKESRNGPGVSPLTLGPINADDRSERDTGIFNSGLIWLDQLHPLPSSPLGQAALMGSEGGPMLVSVRVLGPDRRSLVAVTTLSAAEQGAYYNALSDFLTIQSAAALAPSAMKVSAPLVDRVVAEQAQRMTLRAAAIDAIPLLADVPEPTDAQVAEQFARYAGTAAGAAAKGNPFGFGYRVPDRVKLEWITIDRAAVRAAVEAKRSAYEWDVDARMEFAKNPERFASLAPSSQPADGVAASRPAFDSVKAGAIRLVVDRAADARVAEIERRLRSILTRDYQNWTAARTAKTTTAPTEVGAPIEASDYLDRVATALATQFEIAPKVERLTDAFYDAESLASKAPAFAAMSRVDFDERSMRAPADADAPSYALRAATTRPADEHVGEAPLQIYQPSQTVTDVDGSQRAIFRVVAAEASHPAADLAAVRDRVAYDWRVTQAQAKAVERASEAAEAIRAGRSPDSAGLNWRTVALDDASLPKTLELTQPAAAQFVAAANDALLTGTPDARPAAALSVPLARRAYVAQRERLEAAWQSADALAMLREQGRTIVANRMTVPASAQNPFGLADYSLDMAFLEAARIYDRTGWTPVAGASH